MNVVFGLYQPDRATIRSAGKDVSSTACDAIATASAWCTSTSS